MKHTLISLATFLPKKFEIWKSRTFRGLDLDMNDKNRSKKKKDSGFPHASACVEIRALLRNVTPMF